MDGVVEARAGLADPTSRPDISASKIGERESYSERFVPQTLKLAFLSPFPGVWSWDVVQRIEAETFRLFGPDSVDQLVGCEAAQGLEWATQYKRHRRSKTTPNALYLCFPTAVPPVKSLFSKFG